MAQTTITEALAETKLIEKRIRSKTDALLPYVARLDRLKDPMANEPGGSAGWLEREFQAIRDLQVRLLRIRAQIAAANARTRLSVEGTDRSVAEWLIWRREVEPSERNLWRQIAQRIEMGRTEAKKLGTQVVPEGQAKNMNDIVVVVDEADVLRRMETLDTIMGVLDGKLSLINATTTIEVD